MNECEAPESNKTNVGWWFTRNILAVITSLEGISSIAV
jgi:hypothetical protein